MIFDSVHLLVIPSKSEDLYVSTEVSISIILDLLTAEDSCISAVTVLTRTAIISNLTLNLSHGVGAKGVRPV